MKDRAIIDPKLIALLKKHWPKSRYGQTELFCEWCYECFYYVGWYCKGDATVHTTMISYPASSPAGFITAGRSMVFDTAGKPFFRDGFNGS